MHRSIVAALAALALVPLAGCGDKTSDTAAADTESAKVSSGTLAGEIGSAAGMTTVATALKGTGLAGIFDGSAPYTLLAPDDDAFGALGETGAMLKAPENGAAMAEVLKSHILPGYVTVADIDAAIKRAEGKPVKMTTMDGAELSFARNGEDLTVTAADGSTAKVDGSELAASNGVAIPIDGVLKKVPAAG
ncbi:MAG TPA: fasciclin domain-containing protein [Reyranella sp.]|nr:fasciclin domain-containing protein [Reyranella sp.]